MAAAATLNRAPNLALSAPPASVPEGAAATASGTWSDVDGDAVTLTASTGTVTRGTGTWSWTATRGDDLTLPVTVTATDAVGAVRTVALTARWTNVAPTATLATAGATVWNGATVSFVRAGTPATFRVQLADPGSDDLSTSWVFGDGGRALARSLLRPPSRDALPSPSVEPRATTSSVTHTWPRACSHTLTVRATDDDGGASPTRNRTVVVLGTSTVPRPLAWWQAEYRGLTSTLTTAERTCLLSTARTLEHGVRRAAGAVERDGCRGRAAAERTGHAARHPDAELLAVWLDVATGSVPLAKPLDADGNGTTETTVGAFLARDRVHAQRIVRDVIGPRAAHDRAAADRLRRLSPARRRRGSGSVVRRERRRRRRARRG